MVLYWKESSNILFHFILITYVLKFLFLSFLILFLKKPLWRVCDWVRDPIYASGPWDSHILVSKMGRQVGAFWALALECFLCIPSLGFNARSPSTNFEKVPKFTEEWLQLLMVPNSISFRVLFTVLCTSMEKVDTFIYIGKFEQNELKLCIYCCLCSCLECLPFIIVCLAFVEDHLPCEIFMREMDPYLCPTSTWKHSPTLKCFLSMDVA